MVTGFANFTTADDGSLVFSGSGEKQRLPALTIISCNQLERAGESTFLKRRGNTEISRNMPDFIAPGQTWGRPLDDPCISRKPILLEPEGTNGMVIDNTRLGKRFRVDGIPCQGRVKVSRGDLERGVILELGNRACLLLHLKNFDAEPLPAEHGLIGVSDVMIALRREITRLRQLETTVLLRGASGTGKELVASALATGRSGKAPYVRVNMAAIPTELAAAALFGSVRGAYTGADQSREGYFAAADGGTLFLDEIGETPPAIQPLLLRALESGEIQAVGADRPRKVHVRLVAATDADLERMVQRGTFRAPLLHRLSGYEVKVPSLAQRREDIGVLFHHFARQELARLGKVACLGADVPTKPPWLPASMAARLLRHPFPGNVRELRNLVSRAAVLAADADYLTQDHLGELPGQVPNGQRRARELGKLELTEALAHNEFDIKATAQNLGISRTALYRRIEKFALLRKVSDLDPKEIIAAYADHAGQLVETARTLRVSLPALRRRMVELNVN